VGEVPLVLATALNEYAWKAKDALEKEHNGLSCLFNIDLIPVRWEPSMFSLFFNRQSPWDKIKSFAGKKVDGDPDYLYNIDGYSLINIHRMHSLASQVLFWTTVLFTSSTMGNLTFPTSGHEWESKFIALGSGLAHQFNQFLIRFPLPRD